MRKTFIYKRSEESSQSGKHEQKGIHILDDEKNTLYVIFGSRTGNSKAAADLACRYAGYLGLKSALIDMAVIDPKEFTGFKNILLAVSTHGEGDPPVVAEKFYNFIHSSEAPEMRDVRFSILALGDSSYRDFCKTGHDIRKRFIDLGAKEQVPLIECDIDYEENAMDWVRQAVSSFEAVLPAERIAKAKNFAFEINKKISAHENVFYARVLEKKLLTDPLLEKRTYHYALSLEGFSDKLLPGDSFGVYISNSRILVDSLLKELNFDGTIPVKSINGRKLLKEALISDYEITLLTPVVIEKYATLTRNRELKFLVKNPEFLKEYSSNRDLLDLVKDYPFEESPESLLSILRHLAPRFYSVASSPLALPGEVHFTASIIEYRLNNREHRGVCSVYLADRVETGDSIPVFLEKNEKFRLPEDDNKPMIMIGTGTGIAPYRAFLQQREYTGAEGKNWLFFGDRYAGSDFLYKDEVEGYSHNGLLTYLTTAFSRDQSVKVYIQHQLQKHGKELFRWIDQENAVVYICGNKRTMGQAVKSCLEQIVISEGGYSPGVALQYLQNMKAERRYQMDLY
ncbi:MAG: sulfite reductase flavoprotein subunit alpha [Bacteroidales bacterium]